MRSILLALLVFIFSALFFLLYFLPVSQIQSWLPNESQIRLNAPVGSLAEGGFDQVSHNDIALGKLQFEWIPWRVFLTQASADTSLSGSGVNLTTQVNYGLISKGFSLNDVVVSASPSELLELPIEGKLKGSLPLVEYTDEEVYVEGNLIWQGLASALLPKINLGDIQFKAENNRLLLSSLNDGVDIEISGEVVLSPESLVYEVDLLPKNSQGKQALGRMSNMGKLNSNGSLLLKGSL